MQDLSCSFYTHFLVLARLPLSLRKPELRKTNDGNILFSPVGISTALGMLLLGAQGSTAWQLQQVFHFEKDTEISRIKAEEKETEKPEKIHQQFQKFLTELSKPTNDHELSITNRLFGERTYLFLQKYLDYVEKYYHASLEPVDFINATEESQKKINSWVESQTHEKIKDLLPDGSLSSATKLVLVNTVYFRGQWDAEFKKENTKEEEFWLNKDTSKSVPMMKQYHSFHFTSLEDLQAKILGIPYKGNDLSMFVLLPNDIDGLEKIIDEITPGKLIEWTSPGHMEEKNVNLHFPRFHVEESYELEAVLPAMGMADAFNEHTADFSGMSSRSGLHAQKFLHRSLIVATEEGTEATAATGMGLVNTSGRDHENFHCNHPFLFFIKQSGADSILFFGRFSSP
ncbi:serpin B13-like isoform X2 [Tamandua tetradactyla]|uniref:serpin B13-like isoform X2 n=1 Tax=Tamandua tetradactyla TaxID=48850 RepID=UPI004053FC79